MAAKKETKKSTVKRSVAKQQSKEELIAEIKAEVKQELKSEGKIGPKYAGFWIRFLATMIDGFIVNIVAFFIGLFVGIIAAIIIGLGEGGISEDSALGLGLNFIGLLLSWTYYVFMTGKYGATLGKMALKLKVVNKDEFTDVTYLTAFLREVVGKIVNVITLLIGYIWAGFDSKKQGFHDKIADTVVVYKETL